MTAPLRDRLATLFKSVSAPSEDALWLALADALLASEEWRAREDLVQAVDDLIRGDGVYAAHWRAMRLALARLDAVRGKEPTS